MIFRQQPKTTLARALNQVETELVSALRVMFESLTVLGDLVVMTTVASLLKRGAGVPVLSGHGLSNQ